MPSARTILAATVISVALSFATAGRAQVADSLNRATVHGIVYDSIARSALGGAIVQIARVDNPTVSRSGTADSLGRFSIPDVAPGPYIIGFMHPILDSLGLDMPMRRITVPGGGSVSADVAIPGPKRLAAAVCRGHAPADSSGVVMGILRDANSMMPVADAAVLAQWLELSFSSRGFQTSTPRVIARTESNGWFALCGVPASGRMGVLATTGADSTGLIELEMPPGGFLRHDLYVAAAGVQTVRDSVTGDSVPPISRLLRTGTMAMRGTVLTTEGARPLAGASVTIEEGPQATTDARGEWRIVNAPAGTRNVTTRAVGYYPETRVVDITPGVAPLRTSLSTLKAVLDTVKVTSTRLFDRDRNGFQQRRRMGVGRYLTPEDIEHRHAMETTDLFQMMPGMRVVHSGFDTRLLMRGSGMSAWCTPAIFVDGMRIELSGGDLDGWVQPHDITGVEVYSAGLAPVQYQTLTGCGSVVIWTR